MILLKKNSRSDNSWQELFRNIVESHHGLGIALPIYLFVLAILSAFIAYTPKDLPRLYKEGEIALVDVVADHQVLIKDMKAIAVRRSQIEFSQAPVFDLSIKPYKLFEENLKATMEGLRTHSISIYPGGELAQRIQGSSPLNYFLGNFAPDYVREALQELEEPSVRIFILNRLLPLLKNRSESGLVGSPRASRVTANGVIIRNLDTGVKTLRRDMATLPDVQSLLLEVSDMARADPTLSPNAVRAIGVILSAKLPETLTFNRAATLELVQKAEAEMGPIYYRVQKGEIVVRRGERVNADQRVKLAELYKGEELAFNWQRALGFFLSSCILSLGLFVSVKGKVNIPIRRKDLYLVAAALVFMTGIARGIYLCEQSYGGSALSDALSFVFPLGGVVGFISMIFAGRRYVTIAILLIFFSAVAMRMGNPLILFHFSTAMLATWLAMNFVSRRDAVWGIVPLLFGECVIAWATAMLLSTPLDEYPLMFVSACINSVLSVFLYFSLSPLCEAIFGYSTRFRLLECMSIDQPLMQRIMVTIPGTYNHSVVVASMVEAAAKDVGANSLLCKVAALYHDAGKLVSPMFFVENLQGRPNKHDKLPPSTSARIILSHVRKGVELCRRNKLGEEVINLVAQHHGTRTVRFFYQKAIDAGQNPKIEEYSYSGPRPQSKEAAILMLADSVEASSRVLTDTTPEKLRIHIDKIIKGIFMEGQLDESALTFKDLSTIATSFQQVLTGLFHQRIAYPEQKDLPAQHSSILAKPLVDIKPSLVAGGSSSEEKQTEETAKAATQNKLLGQGDSNEPLSLQTPKK